MARGHAQQPSINQYAESGTWVVAYVNLEDAITNSRRYYTADLVTAGFPTQLQVISDQDVASPVLTTLDFTPTSIDVTGGPASVSCQISAQDAPSGVYRVDVAFRSPTAMQYASCSATSPSSGSTQDGTWSCSATINQYAESGTWVVAYVNLEDAITNSRRYYTADLTHFGYPTELQVCSDHLGRDIDADGRGDDCDNCPSAYNPNQLDGDGDQVGEVCDDCPTDYDPSQSDFDQNGDGDRCDLNDGLIYVYIIDKDYIDWQNEVGPNAWNVYEGDLDVLRSTGVYTQQPSSNPLADRQCHLSLNYAVNLEIPPEGSVQFSLITGVTGFVEGSLGTNSAGVPRANANPCP